MTDAMKTAADRVGHSLVAATTSLSDAVQHTCTAIASTVAGEDETSQFGATRREGKRLLNALGAIMDARQSQIHARTAAFRRAQTMGVDDYGTSCTCLGTDEAPVMESVRLAVVA